MASSSLLMVRRLRERRRAAALHRVRVAPRRDRVPVVQLRRRRVPHPVVLRRQVEEHQGGPPVLAVVAAVRVERAAPAAAT